MKKLLLLLLLLLWVVAADALATWRSSALDPRPFHAQQPQHNPSSHQEFSYYRHDLATARSNPPLFLQVPNAPSRSIQRKQSTQLPASLIPHDDAWGNWAALTGFAAVSQVLGQKTMIGRLLGAPVTAMACTFAAASVGILHPGGTAAARALQLLSLQLATPLILLGADLRYARRSSGPLLVSFAAAATGTLLACAVGWRLAGASLSRALPIGGDGLKIAAALLAKNIGGGINYIAVCRSLDASATAVAAGLCVDNLFALVYFPVTSALATGLADVEQDDSSQQARHNKKNNSDDDDDSTEEQATRTIIEQQSKEISTVKLNKPTTSDTSSITVQSVSTVLFLSATLLWLGEAIGGVSGGLPACTVLTVVTASLAPNRWMQPLRPAADNLGLVALYLFFATAGAPGMLVAESVKAALIPLSVFLTCLYSLHGTVLMLVHKFCGNDKLGGAFRPQRLLVASSAAIGGPATAVALAASAQWPSLAVPSILVGNIGYAIATFCGLGFYAWFR